MTPVRLKPAALRSQVKHSTTEPLHSLLFLAGPHIYSNKKETSDFQGTVSFDQVKMLQQK